MNRVALRHLCWVLLVLYGVSGSEEEISPRPSTTLRFPKTRRPPSIRNIGNTLKKVTENDFKPVFSEEPASSTVPIVSRLSTKRASNEYLASNTVPVAAVTETLRKSYRPGPSHLLTYQALSTTEKDSDRVDSSITPTGWALVSLGPSKNGSTLPNAKKNNNVPLGTTKPVTNYWSTRLHPGRRPALRPTNAPPADIRITDPEKKETNSIFPVENLVKNDNNSTTNSSYNLLRDQAGVFSPSSTERENVLEEPSVPSKSQKQDSSTMPQSSVITTESAPNAKNNLIKGVDLGSKILQGIIAVTNASEYFNEGKNRRTSATTTVNSTEEGLSDWEPTKAPKPLDDANTVVDLVLPVTKHPLKDVSPVVVTAAISSTSSEESTSAEKVSPTHSHVMAVSSSGGRFTTTTEVSSDIKQKDTDKGANLVEDSTSATASTNSATSPVTPRTQRSDAPEDNVSVSSLPTVAITEMRKEMSEYREQPLSSSAAPSDLLNQTTQSVIEANVTIQTTTNPSRMSATTMPQEMNDIPEPEIQVKNKDMPGLNEGTERLVSPVSTATQAPTTERRPLPIEPIEETLTTEASSATTPHVVVIVTQAGTSIRTTTEVMDDVATSTQSYDVTTIRMDSEATVTTMRPAAPSDKLNQEEVITRETTDVPIETTVKTERIGRANGTTENSNPEILETTTVQYSAKVSNESVKVETGVADEIHSGTNKGEEDHDETLKYNVTVIDHDKMHNSTEQDTDYDPSDKDKDTNLDDDEDEGDVSTTTTVVIIEEITTHKSTTVTTQPAAATTTSITTTMATTPRETPSTTTEKVTEHTKVKTDEYIGEPIRLRLVFQASYKEMCLVKDTLVESVAAFFKGVTARPIHPSQVKLLNLGMNECASKALPLLEKVPVILQLTDIQGRGDQNLTDVLYSYIKQGQFNFKYPLSSVEVSQRPLMMEEDNQWGGTVIAAIVISSVAGVSLLCLTILLVIMRKRQKGFTYGQRCTPVSLEDYSLDNISVFNSVRRKAMRASKRSYGNPAFDDPVTVTNPLNFVGLSNMANSHTKIDSEYSEVPTVTVKHDELPHGAENKNRYANVIPIPETRVPLNGPEGEDVFINANYVKGAKGVEKFYIACQAPLETTIADFWMMIWEQQSRVILMLTALHENGVEKCADYLPPSEVLDCHRIFGDLQVTLKKREVREKYVISTLQLKNLESNLFREVIHLWYTAWPIRGVPDDLTSIIAYLIEMRSYSKPGHPIVVHCSPGTGRTGTIIAIDTAIRDFETERTVDIPKTVYSIRRDRAGAVQTNMQYYLIYQVIHLYATKLSGGSLDSI